MPRLTSGPAIAAVTLGLVCMGAAGWAIAGGPTPPTIAEVLDLAYCQGWDRAAANLTERGAVIRAVFKSEEQWEMAREAMDIGECPRSKPRLIGQPLTPPPSK